jgi:hypothetical protein
MQPEFALRPDSSVVERGPEKAGVGGSIPSLATTPLFSRIPSRAKADARQRSNHARGPEKAHRRRFNPVSGDHILEKVTVNQENPKEAFSPWTITGELLHGRSRLEESREHIPSTPPTPARLGAER